MNTVASNFNVLRILAFKLLLCEFLALLSLCKEGEKNRKASIEEELILSFLLILVHWDLSNFDQPLHIVEALVLGLIRTVEIYEHRQILLKYFYRI